MILGIGSDIVENDRIQKLHKKHGDRFLQRVYTADEIGYSFSHADPYPYLAARFAVKEAAIKALGLSGGAGIAWLDVETAGAVFGKKELRFHGRAREEERKRRVTRRHLTLSHTGGMSMAVVILERESFWVRLLGR